MDTEGLPIPESREAGEARLAELEAWVANYNALDAQKVNVALERAFLKGWLLEAPVAEPEDG